MQSAYNFDSHSFLDPQGREAGMSHHVEIRSRSGNVALAVVGVIYFLSAIGTLGAAHLVDRILQLALIGSALAGAAFLVIAADNLKISLRRRSPDGSPGHRRAAAA
jgi:hypothetical protein